MSGEVPQQAQPSSASNLSPALGLAILGGCAIGAFILLKQLPGRHLTKSDVQRLLFYRYLREKGKLES
jgi:hypothetical protein